MNRWMLALFMCCLVLAQGEGRKSPSAAKKSPVSATTGKAGDKDLVLRLGLPKRFHGYLLEKRDGRVTQIFDGGWQKAPKILGGDAQAEWSSMGALLRDLDEPNGNQVRVLSFNLGRRGGHWQVRLFDWEKALFGNEFKPATVKDEGVGSLRDGTYTFETDRYRLVFFPADRAWAAQDLRVFRFQGTDFVPATKLAPHIAYGNFAGATQIAPLWAAGSYVVLHDQHLGRLIYREYGQEGRYWMVRFVREGEVIYQEPEKYFEGSTPKKEGDGDFAALYENGMADFKNERSGATTFWLSLVFKDPMNLSEVRYQGKGWSVGATPSAESSLYGKACEVEIPATTKSEVLARAAEPAWMASGGPYSLRKMLNVAFEGCIAQSPFPSMTPETTTGADQINEQASKAYLEKCGVWNANAREMGAVKGPFLIRKKPFPLGFVLTKEEVEAEKSSRGR